MSSNDYACNSLFIISRHYNIPFLLSGLILLVHSLCTTTSLHFLYSNYLSHPHSLHFRSHVLKVELCLSLDPSHQAIVCQSVNLSTLLFVVHLGWLSSIVTSVLSILLVITAFLYHPCEGNLCLDYISFDVCPSLCKVLNYN